MVAKLKKFWASLPAGWQAAITTFAATFVATFAHAVDEGGCFTTLCLRHYARTAVITAAVALRAFYMQPSKSAVVSPVSENPNTKSDNVGKI
jgi:hypothetical protein